jgi:hypothetical protein
LFGTAAADAGDWCCFDWVLVQIKSSQLLEDTLYAFLISSLFILTKSLMLPSSWNLALIDS